MNEEQVHTLHGMLVAAGATIAALAGAYVLGGIGFSVSAPAASALAALALVFSIGRIAQKRFFDTASIAGAAYDTPGSEVAIDRAVLQNSLEQVVLAALVYNALSVVNAQVAAALLPVLVVLFLVGRILFIHGYRHGVTGRALGFGLTFYPTVVTYILVLIFMVVR